LIERVKDASDSKFAALKLTYSTVKLFRILGMNEIFITGAFSFNFDDWILSVKLR